MTRDVFDDLDRQHEELGGLLGGLESDGWGRRTRCDGWNVADVVLHLAQTDEFVIAGCVGQPTSASASFFPEGADIGSVDDAAELAIQRERGLPRDALLARWSAASARSRALLRERPADQRVPWVIGTLPPKTLATTRLAESWIHTDDIAHALGAPVTADDRLWHIARLAWRTLPYAFERSGAAMSGPVALQLSAPSGELWEFSGEEPATTTVTGPALDWCLLAARRKSSSDTALNAVGLDAEEVLALARTYA